jgi:signal transduction histidine kinase
VVAAARRRITVIAVSGLAMIAFLTAVIAGGALFNSLGRSSDAALRAHAEDAARRMAAGQTASSGTDADGDRVLVLSVAADGSLVPVPGEQVDGIPDAAAMAAAAASGSDIRDIVGRIGGVDVRMRTATVAVHAPDGAIAGWAVAAIPSSDFAAERGNLIISMLIALVASLLAGGAIALAVVRRALEPVQAALEREHRLLADASHEMRTPVSVITGAAGILSQEGLVSPDGETLLADISAESARLRRLIDELLSVSRLEALGKQRLTLAPADIWAVLSTVASRAALLPSASGASVRAVPVSPPVTADIDAGRIEGLLLSLVENALRAAPAGSEVVLGAAAGSRRVSITVDDAGPGIPADKRNRVFAPFARLESGSGDGEGTGLGLAIARSVAEAHGGSLTAEESPQGGARLLLVLPLSQG